MGSEPLQPIRVSLPKPQYEALRLRASQSGEPVETLVAEAIEEWLRWRSVPSVG